VPDLARVCVGRTWKSSPTSPPNRLLVRKPDAGDGGEPGRGLRLCLHVRGSCARVNSPQPPRCAEACRSVNCPKRTRSHGQANIAGGHAGAHRLRP
jgi:hypothetical protein